MPDPIPAEQTTWGSLVVIYLFIAGVGAGAYLTAWWAERRGLSDRVAVVGRRLAGPLVALGALLLVFDLGAGLTHPWRIVWLYTHPTSMMSLGIWILSVFMVLAVIDGYASLVKFRGRRLPRLRALGTVAAVTAVGVMVYTGLLLGVIGAVPFWNNPALPLLFLVSALSTGMAATLAGSVIVSRRADGVAAFGGLHIGLVGTEALVLAVLLFFAATSHQATTRSSFQAITQGGLAPVFWLGLVTLGLAVPLVYNLIGRRPAGAVLHAPVPVLLECAAVLIGGFLLRHLIVAAGMVGHGFVSI
ncbi:MAG: polysulfide reductase NrfD [Propionibacteriaceae bacterium]|jgi:formate-dependent nitrite reductase membrane component NrfD|nr:polysulfide reductase NrfD [Propionibacteriaceae bacterium]